MAEEAETVHSVSQAIRSYGALIAGFLQLLGVLVYISHWEATVDQRLTAVESQQITISNNMDKLNTAREADQIHLTHVDDRLSDMYAKVSAMFNILTQQGDSDPDAQVAPAQPAATPQAPGNFPRPQGRKG